MIRLAAAVWLLLLLPTGTLEEPDMVFRQPLPLGCERAGVRLSRVNTMVVLPIEAGQRVAVSYRGRIQLVQGMGQFRGLLHIENGDAALRFVRLRTSPATWYLWPEGPAEVEIVAGSRIRSLPNYGLPGLGQWL